jgi:hypothetical protein
MTLINYVDYKHSYAHAIASKLKALNYSANVKKMPINYCRKIVLNALNDNSVRFTEKEQQFYDTVMSMYDSQQLYYYCRNCVNKAKETFVYVDDEGEFTRFA